MKTIELLKSYASVKSSPPKDGWERTVWIAADLVRTAMKERGTSRKARVASEQKFVQEELFNN